MKENRVRVKKITTISGRVFYSKPSPEDMPSPEYRIRLLENCPTEDPIAEAVTIEMSLEDYQSIPATIDASAYFSNLS